MGYTIWPDGLIGDALQAVYKERQRQETLKAQGRFVYSCADAGISHLENYTILGEEFGEVGHVLNEAVGGRIFDIQKLREELIQVAAVAVAWIEKVDTDIEGHRRASRELSKKDGLCPKCGLRTDRVGPRDCSECGPGGNHP